MKGILYYLAEDDARKSKGATEDEAYTHFMEEVGDEPYRIIAIHKDDGVDVEGDVVWTNFYQEDGTGTH